MKSELPYEGFERAAKTLKPKFFADLEKTHNIKVPEYCRDIIRNSMAFEIGERVEDERAQESYQRLWLPVAHLREAIEEERQHKITALHHLDRLLAGLVRLAPRRTTRSTTRRSDRTTERLDRLDNTLEQIELEFAAQLPTPSRKKRRGSEKFERLANLHMKLGIDTSRGRGAPSKNRGPLFSELAWVWNEIGQSVIAKKNPTQKFFRFVQDIAQRFPDLKLQANLAEDLKKWNRENKPLTAEERANNETLAAQYREGSLGFGMTSLMPGVVGWPRLRFDAKRPQGK